MRVLSYNLKLNLIRSALVVGFFFLIFLLPSFISQVKAAATSTLRGIAWWGVYGDVYFNCLDYESGSRFDMEGNLTYPPGFLFYSAPCSYGNDHYVGIDENNNFFGRAWNFGQGYIAFSGTSTPPDGYGITSSKCTATCNASNGCWACYNEAEKRIYGWAQVVASGEWIRLDPSFSSIGPYKPVSLETCAAEPIIFKSEYPTPLPANISPGDFFGAATSTNSLMYFNCLADPGSNNCLTRNYKVYVSNITIGEMTAPNFSYAQACLSPTGLGATLGWCVRSGRQSAYEIVVDVNDFGEVPSAANIANARCYSGKKYSEFANQYIIPNYDSNCFKTIGLEYNKNYYWWIRVYDENGVPSEWYKYSNNTYTDSDNNVDDDAETFSTFSHKFPSPYLTWPDEDVLVGTTTEFTSIGPVPGIEDSVYYTSASPAVPQSCNESTCFYLWETTDSLAIISTPNKSTTSIIFNQATSTSVSLTITDLENYTCTAALPLKKINYGLPLWREVKAR